MNARAVRILAGVFLAANGLLPGLAWAQNQPTKQHESLDATPIGKVMSLTGTVHIDHPTASVVLVNLPTGDQNTKAGEMIYRNDVISTGSDGSVNIAFNDGTSFNVSKNAKMSIDDFVYDPKGSSNSALFDLTKGTFTFIAGNTAHTGDMKVNTPLGTMGIRGTAPRVEILENGTVILSTNVERK